MSTIWWQLMKKILDEEFDNLRKIIDANQHYMEFSEDPQYGQGVDNGRMYCADEVQMWLEELEKRLKQGY